LSLHEQADISLTSPKDHSKVGERISLMAISSVRAARTVRPEQMAVRGNGAARIDTAPAVASGLNRGLLRVEEAAKWLGLSRTKAYELVYRGTLPSVTIGRSRRVPMAALVAFVDRLLENGSIV
jgi:excisionase family DNA binding protein